MKKRSTVEEISRQVFGDDDVSNPDSDVISIESDEELEISRKRKKPKELEYDEPIDIENNILNTKTAPETIFKTNDPEEITKILKEFQKEGNTKEHAIISKLKNALEDMMPMFDYDFRILNTTEDYKQKNKDEIDWEVHKTIK